MVQDGFAQTAKFRMAAKQSASIILEAESVLYTKKYEGVEKRSIRVDGPVGQQYCSLLVAPMWHI
jgi:hypothetical protein